MSSPQSKARTQESSRLLQGLLATAGLALVTGVLLFGPKLSLPGSFNNLLMVTWSLLVGAFPFIVLGAGLAAAVQTFVEFSWLQRVLPSTPWLRRFLLSFGGVLLPVCECGNVPLARGLLLKGLRPSEAIVFLLAAPVINPVTILVTAQVFGWDSPLLFVRIAAGLFLANLLGWLFSRASDEHALLKPAFEASCRTHQHAHRPRLATLPQRTVSEIGALLPALTIGALIAGALQAFVPAEALQAVGNDPVLSVLLMLALAVVVAICSNVDSFFALTFVGTFTGGSLATFLVAAPLIDVKMVALMLTTFRKRTVLLIFTTVALAACGIGLGVNLLAN